MLGVPFNNERCLSWIEPSASGNVFSWNGSPWQIVTLPGLAPAPPGSGWNWIFGSDTAPLPATAKAIQIRFENVRCTTTSQFVMTASEDGITQLAGTNYAYHVPNLNSGAATYTGVASAGAANFPLSATTSAWASSGLSGEVEIFNPGSGADVHPVLTRVTGKNSAGVFITSPGAGAIIGTPAPLKSVRLYCGGGSTGFTGTLMYRPVF
jgi:hypothetical protein